MSDVHFSPNSDEYRSQLRVFELASAQDGAVTRRQLLSLGLSPGRIDRLATQNWLRPLHSGVYAVGHGRFDSASVRRAALLAAGTPTALFRRSAAPQLGLLNEDAIVPELVVPAGRIVRRPALYVHRSRTIDWQRDVVIVDGHPCTTVARTLVDLASVLSRRELQRVAERAEYMRLLDYVAVARTLERAGRPKGAGTLRAVLGSERLGAALAGSGFERTVLAELRRGGAPEPVLQQRFKLPSGEVVRVDMYWPAARLVVEVDGPHHELPLFAAKDAARDAGLAALGVGVYRVPDRRWRREPGTIITEILAALT